jgi:ABC-2 type transport system ATP-binding protein
MQEAEELSDRLAIINEGKMIVEGARADVRDGLGDNRAVEVEVQGPAPAAVAALEDHSLISSVLATDERASTTTIRVQTVEPLASVAPIADIAGTGGVEIPSISLARPTLEDVFVALTGSVITEAGDAETI